MSQIFSARLIYVSLRLVFKVQPLRNSRRKSVSKYLSLLKLNLCDTPEVHPEFCQMFNPNKAGPFEGSFFWVGSV